MDIEVHKLFIDSNISRLNSILSNLKKAPNRVYKRITLNAKLEDARTLYTQITNILAEHESKFPQAEFVFLYKCTRQIYSEIHTLISTKIEYAGNHKISIYTLVCVINFISKLKHKLRGKMVNPKVDIKLGTTLVQTYDGAPGNLEAFIDAVALFNDTVESEFNEATAAQKQAAQVTVIRFVKSRLTGIARQVITGANDLQAITDALKQHCESKITSDGLEAKLRALKQKDSIETFCKEVENLTSQLKSCYVNEQIPVDRANTMAIKKGVDSLISGIKNTDTKLILKAGSFIKINDAIQKVIENVQYTNANNNSPATNAQIFAGRVNYSRGRGETNNRGRGNRNYRYQNSQSHRGHFTNQGGNWSHRGNSSYQRGNWARRGRYPSNMFLAHQPHNQMSQQQQISQMANENMFLAHQPHIQMPQQITQSTNGNIHPLGVPLGRHTQ